MSLHQEVLASVRDVVVVNSDHIALALSLKLRDSSEADKRAAFGGTKQLGWFYLYRRDDMHTDTVMETVQSPYSGHAITSLYKNHRIFNSIGTLLGARERLMQALADKVGLSIESIGITDPLRGEVGLDELSTGQLIDLLAERMGHTILTADNRAVLAPEAA